MAGYDYNQVLSTEVPTKGPPKVGLAKQHSTEMQGEWMGWAIHIIQALWRTVRGRTELCQ